MGQARLKENMHRLRSGPGPDLAPPIMMIIIFLLENTNRCWMYCTVGGALETHMRSSNHCSCQWQHHSSQMSTIEPGM